MYKTHNIVLFVPRNPDLGNILYYFLCSNIKPSFLLNKRLLLQKENISLDINNVVDGVKYICFVQKCISVR